MRVNMALEEKHSCDHAITQLIGEIVKNHELKKMTISVFLEPLQGL